MFRVVSPPIIRTQTNVSTVTVLQVPDVVDTVVCAPDDGWRYHPKHVEQFPDSNKLCNVASCCIYIGINISFIVTKALDHEMKTVYHIHKKKYIYLFCNLHVIIFFP